MPCFKTLSRITSRIINSTSGGGEGNFKRRRFGIDSSNNNVTYDDFGEPLDLDGDVYNEILFSGILQNKKTENDEESKIGGRDNIDNKQKMDILVVPTVDVIRNDIIEYPVDSNDWFRVTKIDYPNGNVFKNIIAIHETRSIK